MEGWIVACKARPHQLYLLKAAKRNAFPFLLVLVYQQQLRILVGLCTPLPTATVDTGRPSLLMVMELRRTAMQWRWTSAERNAYWRKTARLQSKYLYLVQHFLTAFFFVHYFADQHPLKRIYMLMPSFTITDTTLPLDQATAACVQILNLENATAVGRGICTSWRLERAYLRIRDRADCMLKTRAPLSFLSLSLARPLLFHVELKCHTFTFLDHPYGTGVRTLHMNPTLVCRTDWRMLTSASVRAATRGLTRTFWTICSLRRSRGGLQPTTRSGPWCLGTTRATHWHHQRPARYANFKQCCRRCRRKVTPWST